MVYKDPIAQLKKADSVELYYLGLDDEKADCESKLVPMSAMEIDEQKKLYGYEASGGDRSSAHDVLSRDYQSMKPARYHEDGGGGSGDGIRVMEGVNNSPPHSQPKKKVKICHGHSPNITITFITHPPPPELANEHKKKGKRKVVSGGEADKKEEKKYKCWDCDKEFPRYQALGGHRSSCHPKKSQQNNINIVTGKRKFLNLNLNKPPSNDDYDDI